MRLIHESNISDPDAFYAELLQALQGMDQQQAAQFQARLLLVLANQVGDREVLSEAIALAKLED